MSKRLKAKALKKRRVVKAARRKTKKAASVDAILNDRHQTHGTFIDNARVSQSLKWFMRQLPGWELLDEDMKEALDNQALKTSRILSGDPKHADNWLDIAGYAQLVADRLAGLVR